MIYLVNYLVKIERGLHVYCVMLYVIIKAGCSIWTLWAFESVHFQMHICNMARQSLIVSKSTLALFAFIKFSLCMNHGVFSETIRVGVRSRVVAMLTGL